MVKLGFEKRQRTGAFNDTLADALRCPASAQVEHRRARREAQRVAKATLSIPAKERLKLSAEDRQAGRFQPAFQNPGINPAEIDLVLKITIVEVGGREA